MLNYYQSIIEYLHEKCGFKISGYRMSVIEKRINLRIEKTNCSGIENYIEFLKTNQRESVELMNTITIHYSCFFRDPVVFDYLGEKYLPLFISQKLKNNDYNLRIWSAGCASGEEAYSIAIMVLESMQRLNVRFDVNMFATDIDESTLEKARQAQYMFESIENTKFGILERYFRKENNIFHLDESVKKAVNFSRFDMLDENVSVPPDSVFGSFDIVLCRNLLLYYESPTQEIIFEKLYRSLAENGLLILGEAEFVPLKFNRFFKKLTECCNLYIKL